MLRHTLAMALAALALGAPAIAAAKPPPPGYVELKLGGYFPVHSEVSGYEAGMDGELAVGYAPDPGFAFELAAGTFQLQQTTAGQAQRKLRVVPITFALRGTATFGQFQPYAIGGLGAYLVHDELGGQTDQTANFGAFLGIGGNVNLTDRLFLGLEGRYLFLETSTFDSGTRLDGITLTAGVGFRF